MVINYDKWYRICKNYKFNMNLGILCSIIHEKPNFVDECRDYIHDPLREEKIKIEKRKWYGMDDSACHGKLVSL